jgi:hypothetical protein
MITMAYGNHHEKTRCQRGKTGGNTICRMHRGPSLPKQASARPHNGPRSWSAQAVERRESLGDGRSRPSLAFIFNYHCDKEIVLMSLHECAIAFVHYIFPPRTPSHNSHLEAYSIFCPTARPCGIRGGREGSQAKSGKYRGLHPVHSERHAGQASFHVCPM